MKEKYRRVCSLQMRIGRLRHRIIDSRIQKLGIHPGQHFVLVQLSKAGPMTSQAKLAEEMNVSPALVARTLKQLEAGGYICRADSMRDGRRNEITITEKGEAVLQEGLEIFHDVDAHSFAGFTDADIAQFERMLEKLLDNMTSMEQKEMKEI